MGAKFDIVIADLSMPGEDGFAVLKAARTISNRERQSSS
jgi:CheY-like chemotaxis protein